jgi:hypothetical protein
MGVREKTETVTVTKLVPFCDVCGKDCPATQQHSCFVCGRKGGYCCIRGQQLGGDNGKLLELFVNVCKDCDAASKDVCGEPFAESVKAVVAAADAKAVGVLAQWKAWSEERRGRK